MPKTTAQLAKLTEGSKGDLTTVVLDVNNLLSSPKNAEQSVANALAKAEQELQRGQDVLIMTSRDLIVGDDEKKSLDIGTIVARSLVTFLQRVQTRPRYIIAKVTLTRVKSLLHSDASIGRYHLIRHGHQRTWDETCQNCWSGFSWCSVVAV